MSSSVWGTELLNIWCGGYFFLETGLPKCPDGTIPL